jgi:hypothetical protein
VALDQASPRRDRCRPRPQRPCEQSVPSARRCCAAAAPQAARRRSSHASQRFS